MQSKSLPWGRLPHNFGIRAHSQAHLAWECANENKNPAAVACICACANEKTIYVHIYSQHYTPQVLSCVKG